MLKVGVAGYCDKVKNYVAVLENLGATVVVSLELEDFKDCQALVLPGGGDINPSYYNEEMNGSEEPDDFLDSKQYEIIDYFVKNDKKIFGICRGLQFLNVYFGGSLIQDIINKKNHEPKDRENKIDNRHLVFAKEDSFLKDIYGKEFYINSWHHQAIKDVAKDFRVILEAEDGIIEAIEHKSKKIIAMQFHPERMCLLNKKEDMVDGIEIFKYFLSM